MTKIPTPTQHIRLVRDQNEDMKTVNADLDKIAESLRTRPHTLMNINTTIKMVRAVKHLINTLATYGWDVTFESSYGTDFSTIKLVPKDG